MGGVFKYIDKQYIDMIMHEKKTYLISTSCDLIISCSLVPCFGLVQYAGLFKLLGALMSNGAFIGLGCK